MKVRLDSAHTAQTTMTSTPLVLPAENAFRRIAKARQITDELFSVVRQESLYHRPIAERHRIVFYIGHLEAFDWNLLKGLGGQPQHPPRLANLDQLFAFGIDPVDGGLPKDEPKDWPPLEEVEAYVKARRARVDEIVRASGNEESAAKRETLLHVAIEHRLMHAETLAYMFHQLPYSAKNAPADTADEERSGAKIVGTVKMVEVPSGITTLGMRSKDGAFGWDNEFEALDVLVPAFEIDKYKVTNGQFLEFMEAGGYGDERLWRPEDWKWREQSSITHPVFWKQQGEGWLYRGMFAEIPLPLDWPVYVSHAEATAYANWAGKALPTEAEWQRAACGTRAAQQRPYPWGDEAPSRVEGNFDFRRWEPQSVTADEKTNRSAFGIVGMLGNGWEWTSTVFAPFSGFRAFPFYPGYSANFFDGKHFVMKGGSARTAAVLLRRSFRNWFQPHYQYMYAGFRCTAKPRD